MGFSTFVYYINILFIAVSPKQIDINMLICVVTEVFGSF